MHVFVSRPDAVTDPEVLARYHGWLSAEEAARLQRFRFARDRHLYLVAHALTRWALSRAVPGVAPVDWRFDVLEHGRPEVAGPHGPGGGGGVRFNLSHTRGLVACVVTTDGADCGVDVEALDRRVDIEALGRRVFARGERDDLAALPPERRVHRFFELWTLKEAYIKARGLGLRLPLREIDFRLGPRDPAADPIRVRLGAGVGDGPDGWAFALRRLPDHMLAVGLRTAEPLRLEPVDVVPD